MNHQMSAPMNSAQLRATEPEYDETRYATPQNTGQNMGPEAQWNLQQPQQWNGTGAAVMPGGQSSAFEQSQRMKNPVDMETTHNPGNSRDAYHSSLRSLLARNVGYFIVATFLTGTQRMVTWQGILHTVGSDYLVIYQPDYERYISCDFYALKFVQFHNTKNTPFCASSNTWMAQDT